ncbi:MAG TPA: PhoH family protein [Planctomycetota bacterium]|nr:PhoH family protein [Planctomycetota bacterium]
MELVIQVTSHEEAMMLFGLGDRNLKLLRDAFQIEVTGRGTSLRLSGEKDRVERVAAMLQSVISLSRSGVRVGPDYLEKALAREGAPPMAGRDLEPLRAGFDGHGPAGSGHAPAGSGHGGNLPEARSAPRGPPPGARDMADESEAPRGIARSGGQEAYVQAIQKNEIVFCIGPAGTGKTYLAVRMAINFLRGGTIRKLVLCRPAVEAGEKLGFLPGDFQAKINPYLRPLYDALNDILEYDQVKRYLEREIIEILPLAYMRGRTLNNSFIILDEGQNTSIAQMKMFLTRMGMGSRIVVNGDVTQVDLPEGFPSGLIHAQKIIRDISGIAWIEMQKGDIVRHPLVRRIVEAYEGAEPVPR